MNKAIINQEIEIAYEALHQCKIADNEGVIDKSFRGQISSFGAAVTMGSLKAAIAFFSKDENAQVSRSKLMEAILFVLKKRKVAKDNVKSLYDYVLDSNNEDVCKEEITNAAIAIKLAMNLYELKKSR